MATWCLLPEAVERFKKGLKDGKIRPEKLNEMTTDERVSFLSDFVGEQAAEVNKRFEKTHLLKNRDAAMLKWARETSGVLGSRRQALIEKVKARAAEREGKIFNPREEDTFLSSLAEQKIGSTITRDEAKAVFEMAKATEESKAAYDPEKGWRSEADRLEYGANKVMLENYVSGLKQEFRGMKVMEMLKEKAAQTGAALKENPVNGTIAALKDAANGLSNLSVSTVASFDNSFLGRQGIHALFTHPSAWLPAARNSFVDIYNTFGGKETIDALRADILSRENAMNGKYYDAKVLDLNEEQFPTSLPERIPYLGRVFKASEAGFKGSALRMRADLFDLLVDQAKENGVNVGDKFELQSIGKIVNSLTAKGSLGKTGTPGVVKLLLWAPKMLKANIDVLTAHAGQDMSSFAVREAWKNLFKIVATTALILTVAKAMDEDSVDFDPRSSDFGKIKAGDTRFDITGGAGGIVTLASRLLPRALGGGQSKSSTTGKLTPYGTGFGQNTRFDALVQFFTNKVTPPVRVIVDMLKGQTFDGQPVTVEGELSSSMIPIAAQNIIEFLNDPSFTRGAGVAADFVGITANTYADSNLKSGKIPENTKISNESFIDQVVTYAKALGTDPETAFNRIFTGQKIRRVDNGAIIVERMSLEDSSAEKTARGGNNPAMKLDHTIPLQLGGSNDKDNLKLVTTSEWSSYTKVENHLGEMLRDEKITKKEAQDLIVKFKNGEIKAEEILAK